MKVRHEISVTHELSRNFNQIVNSIDVLLTYILKNVDNSTGEPIYTDIAALKADLVNLGLSLKGLKAKIAEFITKRNITFDISQYIDSNLIILNSKLTTIESFLTTTVTDIGKLNTFAKIATAASALTNPAVDVSAVNYDTDTRYVNSTNNLLDASAYTMRGINENDGTPLNMTDEQLKAKVRGYLAMVPSFTRLDLPTELNADMDSMRAVSDYVLAHLDNTPLTDLATYIDTNVPKLPLMRRNWA